MWNWKIKNKVDVNKASGDSIKNSNITIQSSDNSTTMMVEIYRALGRLEGEFKHIKGDIKYIRTNMEKYDERLDKIEHSLFKKG